MHWAQKVAVMYLGAIVIGVWGYCVGKHHWWPYSLIKQVSEFVEGDPEEVKTTVIQKLTNDFGGEPHRKLVTYDANRAHPERTYQTLKLPRKRARRADPQVYLNERATQGLRFIYGSFDHQEGLNGALLLSPDGELLWEWVVHERQISWKQAATEERKFPHGVLVRADGSLIFSFDNGVSLQKFDRCSRQLWATKSRVDHSLNFDPDGRIWGVVSPDKLAVFDAKSGKRAKVVNMKRWVYSNPAIDPLGLRQIDYNNKSRWSTRGGGYWHPNDAEPLPAAYAKAFPQFEPGDLLVSFRSINLIFVISPKSQKIKWWRIGAWRRQHDPDWRPDGTITVFNNNMHQKVSSIVKIDPKTYQHEVIFDGVKEKFYTWMRGKHEILDNGHIVVSSPQQGRVFEVTPEGEVVFEFVNRYDDQRTLLVSEMVTLPVDYFGGYLKEPCGPALSSSITTQKSK